MAPAHFGVEGMLLVRAIDTYRTDAAARAALAPAAELPTPTPAGAKGDRP